MRYVLSTMVCAVAAAALIGPQAARADAKKAGLFVLGIHLGGAEGVAAEFNGFANEEKPGAMALIKRNLKWSVDLAEALKVPNKNLTTLQTEVDMGRLSFAQIESRMGALRLEYQARLAKEVSPAAPALFIMGVHHSGAERISLGASGFPRDQRPGTGKLIERNLGWLRDGAPGIKVSVEPVISLQKATASGASFAFIAGEMEKIRLLWQKELSEQPAFDAASPGILVVNLAGQITTSDPFDRERTKMHARVHEVRLEAGVTYVIDLESGNGQPGPQNPGFFDTWLRVEDAAGKTLAFNDDGGQALNSRLTFVPTQSGTYRLVVTTYQAGATGLYTLKVRQ